MTSFRPAGVSAGILLYSAGVFLFAVNDALGKWLVADYGVSQLMALRTLGASIILMAMLWRRGASLRPRDQVVLHVVRVLCSAGDTFAFYYATRALPLAEVMTFYMAAPLIIVALSALMLGEHVGWLRWLAVAGGLVGVVIVLRPGQAAFSPSALIALTGALLFALTITLTGKLRDTDWLTLTAYQFFGSGLIGAATAAVGWVPPTPTDVGLMITVGIVSMASFMGLTKALSLAPASLLAPFQYASIVWAALMGWMVWGDVPRTSTLIGVAVIVASGVVAIRSRPASGGTTAATP